MGVHGLTTYLRENKRVLGKTIQFPAAGISGDVITTIVVDGWSFIYQLYEQSRLPWVYGGEYKAFAQRVEQVVKAWITVGLKVYFVFDGPTPELKIPTLTSRLNRTNIEHSLLFFRTSPTSRSTPRFLHENRILPPLVHQSCVITLQKIAKETSLLEVHFADEEGDPYAVELAGRLGAYVVGNDSDFVVLNSGRYAGYISLDEMLWTASLPIDDTPTANGGEDEGFRTVVKARKRSAATQQHTAWGLIPPENTPMEGSYPLVGNDFSNHSSTQRNVQSLFFERNLTLSQRITHAASTLSTILNASTQKRKARHQIGSAMDLIDRTVNTLLVRSPSSLAPGEVDAIVDRIVNAALQYAIDKYEGETYGPASLWPTENCALHGDDTCPLPTIFSRALLSRNQEDNDTWPDDNGIMMLKLRTMYLEAYRSGKLQPKLTDVLSTGTFWPKIFLDDPDIENVAISIGRPIRHWIYALLEDAVGLPAPPRRGDGEDVEDPDELIDVAEEDPSDDEDADDLAPLHIELQRLRASEEPSENLTSASSRSRSRPSPHHPKCVIEYVRRGSRMAPEEVQVPSVTALIASSGFGETIDLAVWVPVQLWSLDDRMTLFLQILGSNFPAVRDLPSDRLMACSRSEMGGANTPIFALWRVASSGRGRERGGRARSSHFPCTTRRNGQITPTRTYQQTFRHFLGWRSIPTWTGFIAVPVDALPQVLWDACTLSLEDAFGVEKQKKTRKSNQSPSKTSQFPEQPNSKVKTSGHGLFSLLGDQEA
ncbi:hypothetical protein BU15DRAFT_86527 [Melanogaster broomeanus]|nr:hypothetical protein BU15DRAFT_86527 [Melanogaster broomeanus]